MVLKHYSSPRNQFIVVDVNGSVGKFLYHPLWPTQLKQQQQKKHLEFLRRMSSSLYHYFCHYFLLCEEVDVSNSRDFMNTSFVTLLSV